MFLKLVSVMNRRTGVTTRLIDRAVQDYFTKGIVFLYEDRSATNFNLAIELYQKFLVRMRAEHEIQLDAILSDTRTIDGIRCVVVLNEKLFLDQFELYENAGIICGYISNFFEIRLIDNKFLIIPLNEDSREFYNKNYTVTLWSMLIDVYFIFAKFARDYRTDLKQLTQQYPLTKNESTK